MADSPPSLATAVREYLDWMLVEKDRSAGTVAGYQDDLERFIRFAKAAGKAEAVTAIDRGLVAAYQTDLTRQLSTRNGERLAAATRKRRLVALKSFLKWAYVRKEWFQGDLGGGIDLPKLPGRIPKALDERPRNVLLKDIWKGEEIQQLRDRALVLFLISTGCRISEALALDRDVLRSDRIVVRGKGDRERVVELTPKARRALELYLEARTDPSPALFISLHRGVLSGRLGHAGDGQTAAPAENRLSVRGAQDVCDRVGRAIGIGRFHPHQLRHTLGTMLEEEMGDAVLTADTLGHSGLGTVQTYAKITGRQRREAYGKLEDAGL